MGSHFKYDLSFFALMVGNINDRWVVAKNLKIEPPDGYQGERTELVDMETIAQWSSRASRVADLLA